MSIGGVGSSGGVSPLGDDPHGDLGDAADDAAEEGVISRQPTSSRGPEMHPGLAAALGLAAEELADAVDDPAVDAGPLE